MKKLLVSLLLAVAAHAVAATPCAQFVPDGQFPVLAH